MTVQKAYNPPLSLFSMIDWCYHSLFKKNDYKKSSFLTFLDYTSLLICYAFFGTPALWIPYILVALSTVSYGYKDRVKKRKNLIFNSILVWSPLIVDIACNAVFYFPHLFPIVNLSWITPLLNLLAFSNITLTFMLIFLARKIKSTSAYRNNSGKWNQTLFTVGAVCYMSLLLLWDSPEIIQLITAFVAQPFSTVCMYGVFIFVMCPLVYLQTYFEEMIFRGFIILKNAQKKPAFRAGFWIIVSALFFSLCHFQHIISLGPTMGLAFLGCVFLPSALMWGIATYMTEGIELTHGVHFMHNLILCILFPQQLVTAGASSITQTLYALLMQGLQQFCLLSVPTILGLIYFKSYYKKQKSTNTFNPPLPLNANSISGSSNPKRSANTDSPPLTVLDPTKNNIKEDGNALLKIY